MNNSFKEIENKVNHLIKDIQVKALKVIEIEGVRSIQKNFEVGGRPKWIPSKKKGKAKGTKTLRISGALSSITAVADFQNSKVNIYPGAAARAYARIQQEGGTINRKAYTNARRTKNDGRSVFASKRRDTGRAKKVDVSFSKAHSIVIPARPYMVIPPEDFPGMINAITKAIQLR